MKNIATKFSLSQLYIYTIIFISISSQIFSQIQLTPPAQRFVLRFYGSEMAQVPITTYLNLGSSFTMECWVYLESASPNSIIMGKVTNNPYGDPAYHYTLGFADSTRPNFIQSTGQVGSARTAAAPFYIPLRKWTHLAATLSGNLMCLYVNGDSVAIMTSSGVPQQENSVPFSIGAGVYQNSSVYGFNGALCQVRVWNQARISTELKSNAGSYLTGNENGLLASWPLDEGTSQTPRDQTQTFNMILGSSVVDYFSDPHWVRKSVMEQGPYFSLQEVHNSSLLNLGNVYVNNAKVFDFNNDGKPDIIATLLNPSTFQPNPIVLFENDGFGNFTNVTSKMFGANPPTTIVASAFNVVDVNKDGLPDFIIADEGEDRSPWSGAQMKILMQKPGGTLVDETAARMPQQNDRASTVTVGDINGDGYPDMYVSNGGGSPFPSHFSINDGTGKFIKDTTRLPLQFRQLYTAGAAFVDLNKDGRLALFICKSSVQEPDHLFLNDGTGHFTVAPSTTLPPEPLGSGGRARSCDNMQSVDFNNDGWPDLIGNSSIFGYGSEPMPWLLLNNHDGTFTDASDHIPQQNWLSELDGQGGAIIADFNNDGLMDIYIPGTGGNGSPSHLYLNKGNAYFVDCSDLIPTAKVYNTGVAADFNGDGRTDLVLFSGTDYAVLKNIKSFNLDSIEGPSITTFAPNQGPAGTSVVIQGTNLLGTSAVLFNGISAKFSIVSDNQINALVPVGASTGLIRINNISGAVLSQTNFIVPLIIYNFSPTSGVIGTNVLISGSNFTGSTAVLFGDVAAASFTIIADSLISCTVPNNAITGLISVITPSGTCSSDTNFMVIKPPNQKYALRYNGNQVAIAPLAPQMNLGSHFTMETWLYLESQPVGGYLMGRAIITGDPFQMYAIGFAGDGDQLTFIQTTGQPGSYRSAIALADFPFNQWTHVAATLDSVTMRLYINGSLVASQPSPGIPGINNMRFSVGAGLASQNNNGQSITGALRQARIWNRTLPQSEIQLKSTQYLTGTEPGLVAYWPMDDSTGQVARDLSPNNLNLMLGTTPGVDANDPVWVKLSITASTTALTFLKDWNIISIPVKASTMNSSALFPDFSSPTYSFNGAYQIATALDNGKGFWLKYKKDTTLTVFGTKVNQTTVPVKNGWNLIGPYDWEVAVSNITTTPANIISSQFYEYNNGYVTPFLLSPGKGYWVKVISDGSLNLPTPIMAKINNKPIAGTAEQTEILNITVTDAKEKTGNLNLLKEVTSIIKYDLPPIPPNGVFDLRWSNDRKTEKSGTGIKQMFINSAEYPVTIKVIGEDVRIKDLAGGLVVNQIVKKGGTINITNNSINRLTVEEIDIPTEFKLLQNYPNPFNPETKIGYWLPVSSKVTLKIYDILGREIETLVDLTQDAGKYEVNWKASNYSSGVYFCHIIAGSNLSTMKMLLVK